MATDFTRQPEILKLHTDMVQKLGELFPVKGTKWHTILKKVQLLNLLSVADVEEIETMYDLFLSLVQKKDNGITYGEYTSIRTILGTCDPFAEEIIDHYTGLIHAFYKDNLETVLALQAETSQRDNQSSISAKTTSDDESMAQLVTEKVSPDNELISAAACGHTETVTLLLEKGADPDDVAKKMTFTSGKDQLTSSKSEEADVEPLYEENRDATYIDPEKTFDDRWKNAMEEAEAETEIFIKSVGNREHLLDSDSETEVEDRKSKRTTGFLALQAETSQTDSQSSSISKSSSDDGSMAQLVTIKDLHVAKKMTFTSGKDQLTSSKCEEADVEPLYEENRDLGRYYTRPSSFRHKQLKMGCNIGVMNQKVQNLGGTLGPFVRYNGKTSFLTCAHVLFDVARQGTVDFTYDGSNRIDVVQPALDTPMVSGAACGFIQRAIFNPRMNPSIDMAVVTISDESRLPTKGRFANDDIFRYKTAGFMDLPEYNDGSRVLDVQQFCTTNMVVQFGSKTYLSKGLLEVNGIQVQSPPINLLHRKDIFCMSGQYQVKGLRSTPAFFMPGDSGAAVFMLNGTSLHCIGMAIGSTSTGNAVVTPIAALLDAVGANADIDLSVFP